MNTTKLLAPFGSGPNLESKPLTVIVGTGDKAATFYIGTELAITHSDFFKAALRKGAWKESDEGVVRLPEDHPDLFRVFAQFILTGKIFILGGFMDNITKAQKAVVVLCACWVLGDMLGSAYFKDALLDALCEALQIVRQPDLAVVAYTKSSGCNGFRQLAVDVAAWHPDEMNLITTGMKVGDTFFQDVAVRLHRLRHQDRHLPSGIPPYVRPGCMYHDHEKQHTECYKKIFQY